MQNMIGKRKSTKRTPSPAMSKYDAMALVLQDELRTLHEHLTQGTEYEVYLIALAYDRTNGEGVSVVKGNVENTGILAAVATFLAETSIKITKAFKRDDRSRDPLEPT